MAGGDLGPRQTPWRADTPPPLRRIVCNALSQLSLSYRGKAAGLLKSMVRTAIMQASKTLSLQFILSQEGNCAVWSYCLQIVEKQILALSFIIVALL